MSSRARCALLEQPKSDFDHNAVGFVCFCVVVFDDFFVFPVGLGGHPTYPPSLGSSATTFGRECIIYGARGKGNMGHGLDSDTFCSTRTCMLIMHTWYAIGGRFVASGGIPWLAAALYCRLPQQK